LYPSGLTRTLQMWLGILVLLSNALIYGYYLLRKWRHKPTHDTSSQP
jgi:predicted transporter